MDFRPCASEVTTRVPEQQGETRRERAGGHDAEPCRAQPQREERQLGDAQRHRNANTSNEA